MDRRRFLAAAGTTGAVGLAGCSALSSTTDANATFVSEGKNRYFLFSVDGDEVATAGIRLYTGTAADGPVLFTFWAEQQRETSFSDFRLELTPSNRNAAIYMQAPSGSPFPEFRYAHARDGPGTVVEISDFGAQAEGTLPLEFAYDPWVDDPTLGFDAAFSLSTGGLVSDEIRCEASRDIPVPAET